MFKRGILGFDMANHRAILYNNGTQNIDLTLLSDVARGLIVVLKHPKETENRYVSINTFFMSQATILSVVEKQAGRSFEKELKYAETANREGREAVAKGDYRGFRGGEEFAKGRGSLMSASEE